MRFLVIALGLMATTASSAFALEPKDLIGRWSTEWANAAGEEPNASADVYIMPDADAPDGLDGAWNTPSMNGVMHGTIERGEDGELVWTGRWAPPYATKRRAERSGWSSPIAAASRERRRPTMVGFKTRLGMAADGNRHTFEAYESASASPDKRAKASCMRSGDCFKPDSIHQRTSPMKPPAT